MDILEGKLDKIVQLARQGVGGEKDTAIRMVHKICDKAGLDYDEVMSGEAKIHEYTIKYRGKSQLNIIAGIICKTLDVQTIQYQEYYRNIIFKTTSDKYIEILYLIDIYLRSFKNEKRRLARDLGDAFIIKHELWSPSAKGNKLTDKQYAEWLRKQKLAEGLDSVEVNKAIGDGNV